MNWMTSLYSTHRDRPSKFTVGIRLTERHLLGRIGSRTHQQFGKPDIEVTKGQAESAVISAIKPRSYR